MIISYNNLNEKLYSEDKKNYEINKENKENNSIFLRFETQEIKNSFSFLIGVFGKLDNYTDNNKDFIKLTLKEDIILGNTNNELKAQTKTNYEIEIIKLKTFDTPFEDQDKDIDVFIYEIKISNIDKDLNSIKIQLSTTGDYNTKCLGFQKDSATFYSKNIKILKNEINPTFDKNIYNLNEEDNKLINNYFFDDFSSIVKSGEKVILSFDFINKGENYNIIFTFNSLSNRAQFNLQFHLDTKNNRLRLNDSFLSNSFFRGDYNGTSNSTTHLRIGTEYRLNLIFTQQKIYYEFINGTNKQTGNFNSKILDFIYSAKDKYSLACGLNINDPVSALMFFKYFPNLDKSFYYLGAKSLNKNYLGIYPFDGNFSFYSNDIDLKNALTIALKDKESIFEKKGLNHNRLVLKRDKHGGGQILLYELNLDLSKLKIDNKYKYDKFYMIQPTYVSTNDGSVYSGILFNNAEKEVQSRAITNSINFIIYEIDLLDLKINIKSIKINSDNIEYTNILTDFLKEEINTLDISFIYNQRYNNLCQYYNLGLIFTKDNPEFFLDTCINNFRYPLIDGKFYNGELELIGLQNTKESI